MIPKIIHYCWFGKGPKDGKTLLYIEKWKQVLPDYRIIEWNEDSFPINKTNQYVREAYRLRKFAFVSDVARMYALYNIGGVYLDTDIEILKSFDSYLHHRSFIGYETQNRPGTGVIGSEKGVQWIKEMLEYYKHHHFIQRNGKQSCTNVDILLQLLTQKGIILDGKKQDCLDELTIYPYDYFCAKDCGTGIKQISSNTICMHDYAGTWKNKKRDTLPFIQRIFFELKFRLYNYYIKFTTR